MQHKESLKSTHTNMARCLLHAESRAPPTILGHCNYCQVLSGIFIVLSNYYTVHHKFSQDVPCVHFPPGSSGRLFSDFLRKSW